VIVAVAANPSIDKLFEVDRVLPGAIHRPASFVQVPGGKGLNVARAAHALGGDVVAVALLGGHAGRWVREALAAEGVAVRVARVAAETRACLSVADRGTRELTEFYEEGEPISEDEWAGLEETTLSLLPSATWMTLSGSLPPDAPPDGYQRLIDLARVRGVSTALDARGELLAAALTAGPDLVKVNAEEAAELVERPVTSVSEAASAARTIRERAGGTGHSAVVTRGAEGAVLAAADATCWHGQLREHAPYPVGSGDAFLGGLVVALDRGSAWPAALALALGAGAANAELAGAGRLDAARASSLSVHANVERA
jgi:1-phosphofructokinase family hexose kinase